MKSIIISLLFAASQPNDTTVVIPAAIQVKPVEFNSLTKDSVYQVTWKAFDIVRDTTQGCNTYVQLFDRKGKNVWATNVPIPADIVRQWGTSDAIIDEYILDKLNLKKK